MSIIGVFKDEFFFLSNMYLIDIVYNGIQFNSVEQAYQYHKTASSKEQMKILKCTDPKATKKVAKTFKYVREDWKDVRLNIMYNLLWIKFNDPLLKEALLLTKGYELVEGNWWGDEFWGVCNGVGENYLGKLLMKVRNEIE
jgi:N-glycosidase YbiA